MLKKVPRKKRTKRRVRHSPSHGWIRDLPDHRDFLYAADRKLLRALPQRVDLRKGCPPIYSQGKLHSCTANAIGAAIQFDQRKQSRLKIFRPSRLFIYYNERAVERSIESDAGAQLRTGIKSVAKRGVCPERIWPYREKKFRHRPSKKCYAEAAKHPTLSYYRVRRTLAQMKACLASGYPFVFGFTIYESFHAKKVTRTGRASMPISHERILAGHAVLAVGYDEAQRRFIVRNSWGKKWGMGGHFTLPYDYLTNRYLSADFWTIRVVN